MNIALWIVQALLALAFAIAGITKLVQPRKDLISHMHWVEDFSGTAVKVIGALEAAAAIGLVLPAATGTAVVLTPLAATGLAITMIGAAVTHLRRNEPSHVIVNAVLFALAAFVAWGRFGPYSF
ncbi:putative membrane protein [Thermocatellispora tengchongensis]|uniref:Putative membrane protein n=1 Tax=Thermocatellispora tengchongensis TaxID=1073253 RepID=A0A840PNG1_9ACTN|nr:DoxX family protein [Thermocatellispora tengchongensis]MBB5140469.1 putative membrane protein [Thermocatellispora tengchongensis]